MPSPAVKDPNAIAGTQAALAIYYQALSAFGAGQVAAANAWPEEQLKQPVSALVKVLAGVAKLGSVTTLNETQVEGVGGAPTSRSCGGR